MGRVIVCSIHLNSILLFVHCTSITVDLFRDNFRSLIRPNKFRGLVFRYCISRRGHGSRYKTAYFHCTISAKVMILCYDISQLPNWDIQVIYACAGVLAGVLASVFTGVLELRRRRRECQAFARVLHMLNA
jgi:hypothetical protein